MRSTGWIAVGALVPLLACLFCYNPFDDKSKEKTTVIASIESKDPEAAMLLAMNR